MNIKKIVTSFCFAICTLVTLRTEAYLHTEGQYIVNAQGERVLLRGMGLGGWMLQEGYMLELGNLGQQHAIKAKLEDLIGAEATQEFYTAWLANHTRKADIDAMARWGFNSVRLPMHFNLYTLPIEQEPVKGQNTWLENGFALTDALLAWCKANNMYLILDLHAAPGGQGNDLAISDRDPTKASLWDSPENQQKTIALWRKLAERYANEPMIGAYDIINEPNWGFENSDDKNGCKEQKNIPLKNLMVKITNAIREVDTKHMIIIEGNCWGNNYAGVLPTWDNNMTLSFHKYWNKNSVADISTHLQLREKYNVPIWLGESGENSNLWFSDAIRLVESQGVGWAFWPLKKIRYNNPLQVIANENYLKVVAYLNGKAPRPTREEAYKGLMKFATHDIRFENNTQHPAVIDAMFRQPHSSASKPFAQHLIKASGGTINAVDYDMGSNSYFDVDAADYHVSTGQKEFAVWNQGRVYRNDGVDIQVDKKTKSSPSYFISHIETGEWTEYTFIAEKAGDYLFSASVNTDVDSAKISVTLNNQIVMDSVAITKATPWKTQELTKLKLLEGTNTLRITTLTGKYNLATLVFERHKTH